MKRRTFDALASVAGFVLVAVLAVSGGLLVWGHSFITHEVHTQLAAQKIVFPAKGSPALTALPKPDAAAMSAYAGQLMTNGAQAETWADHFIAVHLVKIGGGQTYAQLSARSLAQPKNAALAGQVETVFRGETLRSMLLDAYGFWEMGQIMLVAAWVAFAGAALMLAASGLGIAHLRRVSPAEEIFPAQTGKTPVVTS